MAFDVSNLWSYVQRRGVALRPAPESPRPREMLFWSDAVALRFKQEHEFEDSEFVAEAMRWLNYGYQQAEIRYQGISRGDLRDNRDEMYSVIESTIKALPSTEPNEFVKVEWDVERGIFDAEIVQHWSVGVIEGPMVKDNPSVLHSYDVGKWWVSNCFEDSKTFYFDWNELSSQADIFGFDIDEAINFPMFDSRSEAESARQDGDCIDRCNVSGQYYLCREKYVGRELRITYPKRRKALI